MLVLPCQLISILLLACNRRLSESFPWIQWLEYTITHAELKWFYRTVELPFYFKSEEKELMWALGHETDDSRVPDDHQSDIYSNPSLTLQFLSFKSL